MDNSQDFIEGIDGRNTFRSGQATMEANMPMQPNKRIRYAYKKIPIKVTAAGKFITNAPFNFDKNVIAVAGVACFASDDTRIFNLQNRLEINGVELLPQEFDARMLFSYSSVPVNSGRFFDLQDEPAGNGSVKITCNDSSTDAEFAAAGGAYTVIYQFKLILV